MDDDEKWERELWGRTTREQYLQRGAVAVQALQAHLSVVASCQSDKDMPVIEESAERLGSVLAALSDAQFDFSGTLEPFGLFDADEWQEDDDDDDELDEADHRSVSVLLRRNYLMLSDVEVLAAGRAAYAEMRSDASPADAVHGVSNVGQALYEIMHAHGLEELSDVPGLTPTDGVALFVGRKAPHFDADGPVDVMNDPAAFFALDGDVLFSQSDQW